MEKTHDEVRKIPDSFKKAIFTLSNLESKAKQYSNFRVIINTVVHKYNFAEFTDFYEYFTKNHTANFIWHFARKDEIDVKAIKKNKLLVYQDPIQFHNSQSESILPDISDCNSLIDKMIKFEGNNYLTKWRQQEKKNHLKITFEGKRAVSRCTAPFKGAVVFGNGDMSICEILKLVDNIRDHGYDFFDTWKSEKMDSLRNDASACYCTYPCYLMDSMLYDKRSISEALEN
jgi:MoaA/NifB/PqqE/SkfB family radical SAM enzyme